MEKVLATITKRGGGYTEVVSNTLEELKVVPRDPIRVCEILTF
jgi:hypothetical protein